jgi:iron(III) transport system substrate-binding protein
MAIAKPLYGTTRTHYTVLWHLWGREQLIDWHRDLRERGRLEAQGNAMVKNMVVAGKCDFGWTDTDDFYVAVDQQYPVKLLPVRLDDGQTICIPNTVAIIKGTKRSQAAQALVEFLLSAETEMSLARSKSRQIPLGKVDAAELPREVRRLRQWADDAVDLRHIAASRRPCLEWLKSEYLE